MLASDSDAVDPMHLGTLGRGMKAHDYWAIPVSHRLHVRGHSHGEVSMLRELAPDDLLLAAFRAYAREMFSKWRAG